jgi:CRISPR-associated protein Cmr4
MHEAKDVLYIHALTGLHPGSGTALGVVDLPVQRERHTQWPVIPGSSIKGVVRDACREKQKPNHGHDRKKTNEQDKNIVAAFGPAKITGDGDAYAGAVSFTDARLLAFPVRSLKGVFAWVTCPSVLSRYQRDLGLAGLNDLKDWPDPQPNRAAFNKVLAVDGKTIVLEEFDFTESGADKLEALAKHLAGAMGDKATAERVVTHLVVLNDNDFTHFVRHATEVVARVGLDYDKKTVKTGALFYQEFLPAECVFYSLVLATDSRKDDQKANALLTFVKASLPPVVQIGGDETIGKGLCGLKFKGGK